MSIEIKHRLDGTVLYTAENAQDVRAAVLEAVEAKADLGYADLRYADLGYADLRYADLGSADLRYANLGSANLGSADLGYARNVPDHALESIRQDVWAVLDAAPADVPGLREAMVAGRIDGSCYEGSCACLVGTLANVAEVEYTEIEGLTPDGSRPAEVWFAPICPGDKPVEGDAKPESEGSYRATVALGWLDEWTESRTRLARVLAGVL